MPGDEPAGSGWAFLTTVLSRIDKVQERMDRMAAEVRDDVAALRVEMLEGQQSLRRELLDYAQVHAADHSRQAAESATAHKRFDDYIDAKKLEQARQDGALGMARFLLDVFGRNWKAIAAVLVGAAAMLGNIRVSVGLG